MKNITLSADEDLIERARDVARSRRTTLNSAFREWLQHFASSDRDTASFDALMQQMSHIDSAGPYTRDEMNTR
jgi:DNA replication protein DnaC